MSRNISDLHPDLQPLARELLARCEAAQIGLVITQTLRTLEEQAALYAQGRTKPGKIVTNAKAGESPHNYGLAFDVAFKTPDGGVTWEGPWLRLGEIGVEIGLEWGGNWVGGFVDMPHFQLAQWRGRIAAHPTRPVLRRGATGPDVERLQRLLNAALALEVDGEFGPATEDAVMVFSNRALQNEMIETTPEVWAALEAAAKERET